METFTRAGDVLIGRVFVVHSGFESEQMTFRYHPKPALCKGFHVRYYRDVLGMMFAIDEINKSTDLLPNITLGFSMFDSCMSELRAIWGALSLVSGAKSPIPSYDCHAPSVMVGMVGELVSALSLPIARLLGVLHFPQISHGATLSALSNKMLFPSFLRTVPSNMLQNVAVPQLLGRFGWTWVGMLVVDNDVGEQGGQAIKAGIEKSGGCVAFMEKIHLSYSMKQIHRVVDVIKGSSVQVVVLHSPEVHVIVLLDVLHDREMTGKIFVSSASFGVTPSLFSMKAWKVLNGMLCLIPKTGTMPGFEEFLNDLHPSKSSQYPFIRLFWEKVFQCSWSEDSVSQESSVSLNIAEEGGCRGNEVFGNKLPSLFEINDLSYTYHAYLAVYAYAHALHAISMCSPENYNEPCAKVGSVHPWQILRYLQKTPFRGHASDWMLFNSDGDLPAAYDIINIQIRNKSFNLIKVGTYNPESKDDKITINVTAIAWGEYFDSVPQSVCSNSCRPGYRKSAQLGKPVCCFDCVPCSLGEIINKSGASECFKCPTDQWPNEERTKCVLKVVEFLSFQEPLGVVLVTMVVIFTFFTLWILLIFIKHQDTPIVRATNRELSYILLVSLILCFLCCLVFIGRPSIFTCLLRQTLFSIVFSISISSVLAKTIMVTLAFKATIPNSPLKKWLGPRIPRSVVGLCSVMQTAICSAWLLSAPPFPRLNTESGYNKVIFECHEGQNLFFYVSLGFMGFLALVSFLAAFLARNLPGSFNEAKHITFSMLVFCSVWLSFIPAYLSTRGKYTVAVQIFAILASTAGLLGCIFVPKCYITLLKPERNSKELLRGRKNRSNG
ncbi:extracellular calcium-sensing receptor-like [Pelobates fuscus]|uniref:extracellular calcium-sensing receptor-like n=1 Tax=Pelobates fuscus TaxID=191477 RepID=UPI002FE4AAA5